MNATRMITLLPDTLGRFLKKAELYIDNECGKDERAQV